MRIPFAGHVPCTGSNPREGQAKILQVKPGPLLKSHPAARQMGYFEQTDPFQKRRFFPENDFSVSTRPEFL
jgi:hypothetical protein